MPQASWKYRLQYNVALIPPRQRSVVSVAVKRRDLPVACRNIAQDRAGRRQVEFASSPLRIPKFSAQDRTGALKEDLLHMNDHDTRRLLASDLELRPQVRIAR